MTEEEMKHVVEYEKRIEWLRCGFSATHLDKVLSGKEQGIDLSDIATITGNQISNYFEAHKDSDSPEPHLKAEYTTHQFFFPVSEKVITVLKVKVDFVAVRGGPYQDDGYPDYYILNVQGLDEFEILD